MTLAASQLRAPVFLAIICASCLCPTTTVAGEVQRDSVFAVQRTEAIVYATVPIHDPPDDHDLLLDLYQPVGGGPPSPRPGFIIAHGYGSDRDQPHLARLAATMAGRGYAVVSIDYRHEWQYPQISPEFEPFLAAMVDTLPANELNQLRSWVAYVEDITLAHRWMVENSADLQVDPERIAMGGESRGAAIALFAAYVIDDFGVTLEPSVGAVWSQAGFLYNFDDHIESGEPPLIIVHGTRDGIVPFFLAERTRQYAHWAPVPYDFYAIEGAGHGIDIFRERQGLSVLTRLVSLFHIFLGPPVAVELMSFDLAAHDGVVVVSWKTTSADDHLGFNLLRAGGDDAPYRQVNPTLIAAGDEPESVHEFVDRSVEPAVSYGYRLVALDRAGDRQIFELGMVTAIGAKPSRPVLHRAQPNPFTPGTRLSFDLPVAATVKLTIHDVQGRRVRTLVDEYLGSDNHAVSWDGRDDRGRRLAAGVYVCRCEVGERTLCQKIVLSK